MSTPATRLRMQAQRTMLTAESASVVLEIGHQSVAERFFRHDPPAPGELESAIDAVEDALMSARVPRADPATLVSSDDIRRLIPGLRPDGEATTLDEVEARFQRLASVSLGHPSTLADLPMGRESAAALLILRECMHHLGFAGLVIEPLESPGDKAAGRAS